MGCNCKGEEKVKRREELLKINNKLKKQNNTIMAKYLYQAVEGCSEDARLNFKGDKILVKTATQAILKLLYDNGHPQIEKIEKGDGKKDK